MKIGAPENFLRIGKQDRSDPCSPFVMEACCSANHALFKGFNNSVHFSITPELKEGLVQFEALKINSLHVEMTEECHLQLDRDSHGNILVKYRIAYWRLGSSTGLYGMVQVDGEYSQSFIKDLTHLIRESS